VHFYRIYYPFRASVNAPSSAPYQGFVDGQSPPISRGIAGPFVIGCQRWESSRTTVHDRFISARRPADYESHGAPSALYHAVVFQCFLDGLSSMKYTTSRQSNSCWLYEWLSISSGLCVRAQIGGYKPELPVFQHWPGIFVSWARSAVKLKRLHP
jgi:hypothetical protein